MVGGMRGGGGGVCVCGGGVKGAMEGNTTRWAKAWDIYVSLGGEDVCSPGGTASRGHRQPQPSATTSIGQTMRWSRRPAMHCRDGRRDGCRGDGETGDGGEGRGGAVSADSLARAVSRVHDTLDHTAFVGGGEIVPWGREYGNSIRKKVSREKKRGKTKDTVPITIRTTHVL